MVAQAADSTGAEVPSKARTGHHLLLPPWCMLIFKFHPLFNAFYMSLHEWDLRRTHLDRAGQLRAFVQRCGFTTQSACRCATH